MRRFAIRLAVVLAVLAVISQFALPPYFEHRIEQRLTEHGGSADVQLSAFPALRLLTGHGDKLQILARGLSVDLEQDQAEAFSQLEKFDDVYIRVTGSRAGPFTIADFRVRSLKPHQYAVAMAGGGTAGDVARYAGSRLGGGFGADLADLAASALGGFDRGIPFDARMRITVSGKGPEAEDVAGRVDGLPAGPLAQVVANALLRGL